MLPRVRTGDATTRALLPASGGNNPEGTRHVRSQESFAQETDVDRIPACIERIVQSRKSLS